jgi:hypothetical protein
MAINKETPIAEVQYNGSTIPLVQVVNKISGLNHIDFMANIVTLLKGNKGIMGCYCYSKNETNQNFLSSLVQIPRFFIFNTLDYGMGIMCGFKQVTRFISMDLPSYDHPSATNNIYFTNDGNPITPQEINDLVFDIVYM